METNPTRDVLQTLRKLPPTCFTTLLSNPGQIILIKRGVAGYYKIQSKLSAEQLNSTLDPVPTPAQVMAMENGSMFGFEVPGADPDVCQKTLDAAAARKAVAA